MKTKIIGMLVCSLIPGMLALHATPTLPSGFQEDTLRMHTDTTGMPDTVQFYDPFSDLPAQFPGGDDALNSYIQSHLSYPVIAREQGIEGRIVASVTVDETGKISSIELLNDIGGGCASEVFRVLKNMPNWIPQRKAGKYVASQTRFIFTFKR